MRSNSPASNLSLSKTWQPHEQPSPSEEQEQHAASPNPRSSSHCREDKKGSECDKSLNQSLNLSDYDDIHTGEDTYKFNQCVEVFTQLSSLNRKSILERSLTNVKNVSKSLIRIHILVNMEEFIPEKTKPYKCRKCGKAFIHHSQFTQHMNIHNGL
ncbi:LOW QUALITY PROTEIN: hypothetical protein QTO34_017475 [Cnephaeus nilssonii]|uniref:C2H2-type domain-containing protein n=1 Tax=Cnephaeus nilssonii TaxID=3371016 RepID=A0AA40I164_CNENI|nr:LOW QUALITY PROTEIN: hypothetical protein QTO34_017475 [Eptesicus nilssonii]